jgi:hypothetical protein
LKKERNNDKLTRLEDVKIRGLWLL